MLLRPADASGDILPVLSSTDLVSGPDAAVILVRDRLNLLSGEWWENREWGCGVFEMTRSGRVTESDVPALSSYLTGYIQQTPGVESVEDVRTSVSGRTFTYSCRVTAFSGSGDIDYQASF